MKWFSHSWRNGSMSDAQVDAVLEDYRQHVAALRPLLTAELTALLDADVHDAQVQSYELKEGRFAWRLLTGDLQRGYTFITVTYQDAEVVGGQADLDALRLLDADTELLYDELELLGEGRAIHRVLVWPEGEIWIRFRSVDLAREPATPEARRSSTSRHVGVGARMLRRCAAWRR